MKQEEFDVMQLTQIRLGEEAGLDVGLYADAKYDGFQMEEIRKGMVSGIDISAYNDPALPFDKMREIRQGLEVGIDLSPFALFSAGILKEILHAKQAGVDIQEYIRAGYEPEQLEEIIAALEKKLRISPYLSVRFRGPAIKEIAYGLELGLNVSLYAKEEYDWRQMREMRLGMENRVDVSWYSNPFFDWQQMREIRLGLEAGEDVSPFARLMFTAKDMERRRLFPERYRAHDMEEFEDPGNLVPFVIVSEDGLAAHAVYDPSCVGKAHSEIMRTLKAQGIRSGFLEEGITRLIRGNAKDGELVAIAEGKKPETGDDGYYEYFFDTNPRRTPQLLADGSVDYRNVKWFEVVEEGQKVAVYHESQKGQDGFTVTGLVIPGISGKAMKYLKGKGFKLSSDGKTYTASVHGHIELDGQTLTISPLFFFDDVTLATGDVDVDGSVYVRGRVGSGAKIHATGDIAVDGYVEAAEIRSGGDICFRQGVNAGAKGEIRATGSVTARFFEGAQVIAGTGIYCNYSLNSNLTSTGVIVITGEKASLVGGKVQSRSGLRASNIGNENGVMTEIRIGIDDELIRSETALKNTIEEIKKSIDILSKGCEELKKKYPPEVRNTMKIYLKLEDAIYTKEKELERGTQAQNLVENQIKQSRAACAVVDGRIYKGTVFHFGNLTVRPPESFESVRVRRVKDRITMTSL